jgi:DNA-directed RNA polymerase II subunit RPB2
LEENCITYELSKGNIYKTTFTNVCVNKPMMLSESRELGLLTPQECRMRDMTYAGVVCVDITISTTNKPDTMLYKVPLCKIPIMVKSALCNTPYDDSEYGGYFIVNGKERVIVCQERNAYNVVLAHYKNSHYFVDIRSMSSSTGHSAYIALTLTNPEEIFVTLPHTDKKVSLSTLLSALNIPPPQWAPQWLHTEFAKTTQSEALVQICDRCSLTFNDVQGYLDQMFSHEIFPHMNESSHTQRVEMLFTMMHKLLRTASGERDTDDRDALGTKRIETAGMLIADLFRSSYKNFIRRGKSDMKSNITNFICKYQGIITRDLLKSLITGHWGCRRNLYIRVGVSQILNRLSWTATVSQLRRCMIPVTKEGKCVDMRKLHSSHAYFFCACETPEGQTVGIVKNLAMSCEITSDVNPDLVIDLLLKTGANPSSTITSNNKCARVFVNGAYIRHDPSPAATTLFLRNLRTAGLLDSTIGISFHEYDNEIHINTDEGRCIRPLISVQHLDRLKTSDYNACLENKSIVLLDTLEIEKSVIAATREDVSKYPNIQYLEIHPNFMMGIVGATIPFSANNQAPRNVYYASMCKQAIGIPLNNPRKTFYSDAIHLLMHPMRPLSLTNVSRTFKPQQQATGITCIVAIMCFTGFNVEDSIIVSKAAIDKGLFQSIKYKTLTVSLDGLCIPDRSIQRRGYSYDHLTINGVPKPGTVLKVGDILCGRISRNPLRDNSIIVQSNEDGTVDEVVHTTNAELYPIVKIRISTLKIPELGDKLCSRSAQKSTIGLILEQADMPCTKTGMIPDLILNPHSMPSRMTISQLIDCIIGKKTLDDGITRYCTAMDTETQITNGLVLNGFDNTGLEQLYNGMTGEKFESKIFIGPTYYHKLKHMVSDKMYARGRGGMHEMTRQPKGGRSQNGALRIGELETNAINGLGITSVLHDRMFLMSDKYTMVLCNQCGSPPKMQNWCPDCQSNDICRINIPFSCKLLFQLIQSIGIKMITKAK